MPRTQWTIGAVGDFDGDGRAHIAWYSPLSGSVLRWMMSARGVAPRVESLPGAIGGWTMLPYPELTPSTRRCQRL